MPENNKILTLAQIPVKILLAELKMRDEIKGKTAEEISQMIDEALPEDRAHAQMVKDFRNEGD